MEQINLYGSIDQMKQISVSGGTFSIVFRKWNSQTQKGGDIAYFPKVRIRKKPGENKVCNSSYKVYFTDTETGRPFNCWECLIMEFNGKKIRL